MTTSTGQPTGDLDLDDKEIFVHFISSDPVNVSDPPVVVQGNSDPPAAPEPNTLLVLWCSTFVISLLCTFQRSQRYGL